MDRRIHLVHIAKAGDNLPSRNVVKQHIALD